MNEAIIKSINGNDDLEITVHINSLPFTARINSLVNSGVGIGASFVFSLLMSFIPSSLVAYNIKER